MRRFTSCLLFLTASVASVALADGPADNAPEKIRRVPKLGIEVPADVRQKLEERLAGLDKKIADLQQRNDKRIGELLPGVQSSA